MSVSWLPAPLIPPFRFGTVEPEVYRGAYPKQRNLRYLKRLKLRTILSLIPDAPDEVFQEFCAQQGIRSIHLAVDKVKDNVPLTYNRAVEAVQIIIDQENLPIYIHCLDGASVTGLVVCCLRKLQTWNISSAMGEFLRYLRSGVISSEESVFAEKFSSEIEISKPIPPWLWEGQITFKKHPTLKLKFTIPPAAAAASNATSISASSPGVFSQSATIVFPTNTLADGGQTPGANMQNQNANGSAGGAGGNFGVNGAAVGTMANGASGSSPPAVGGSANAAMSNVNTGAGGRGGGGGGSSVSSTTGLPPSSAASSPSASSSSSSPSTPAPGSSAGLSSHASRSSANNPLRDRPGGSKSIIRTDISGNTSFGSRGTSIATPTTAALARNKRNTVGISSTSSLQQAQSLQQQQQISSQDPSDARAPSPGPTPGAISSGAGGANTNSTSVGSHDITVAHSRSGERLTYGAESGTGGDGDGGTAAKDKSEEVASTEISASQQQQQQQQQHDRNTGNTPTTVKSSPIAAAAAAAEVVDEYYEVSMTLKALALEGADF